MAIDQFIKIGDIQGEAQDATHGGEIDVMFWKWGMRQSGTMHSGSGGGAGKVNFDNLEFIKDLDKSSPVLMQFCSNGTQFPEAKLTVRKAGAEPLEYFIITMKNVIVASFKIYSTGTPVLSEKVVLNFAAVSVEYQPQAADGSAEGGSIRYGWNIAANHAI